MKHNQKLWFVLSMRSFLSVVVFSFCSIITQRDLTQITHWWTILAPMMIAPIAPYLAVLNIFILPLTTTIAEDGVYLGYGVNSFASKWEAILIPAFFYALQHSFIPMVFDMKFITYRFLSFLPLTIWICFQYYKGSSISYIMTGHWFLNIATTVQIVITSFHPEIYAMLQDF